MRLKNFQIISDLTIASLVTTSTALTSNMANWDNPYPPRTASKFPAPGIHVNLEFGFSFSNNDPPHTASMKYTSRNMQERMRLQHQEGFHTQQLPRSSRNLLPGNPQDRQFRQPQGGHRQQYPPTSHVIVPENMQERQSRHQYRPRNLDVRPRAPHERGSSAPPSLLDRNLPTSPVSPITPLLHTSSMPIEGTERPLPAAPSHFRLGEDGLPWSTEPWYREEIELASPTRPTRPTVNTVVAVEPEEIRAEDPQRVRELEDLQQAMMTVDSLSHDGWEPWTWDSVGDIPRGPRSLGWAISTLPSPDESHRQESLEPPPPPYVVSQWEQAFGRSPGDSRPRSALT